MKIVKATYIVILFITGLLAGVFFSSSVSAQEISGTWHGKLSLPTGSLTIVFHISQTEQGAYVTNTGQSRPRSQRYQDTDHFFQ